MRCLRQIALRSAFLTRAAYAHRTSVTQRRPHFYAKKTMKSSIFRPILGRMIWWRHLSRLQVLCLWCCCCNNSNTSNNSDDDYNNSLEIPDDVHERKSFKQTQVFNIYSIKKEVAKRLLSPTWVVPSSHRATTTKQHQRTRLNSTNHSQWPQTPKRHFKWHYVVISHAMTT